MTYDEAATTEPQQHAVEMEYGCPWWHHVMHHSPEAVTSSGIVIAAALGVFGIWLRFRKRSNLK